MWPASDDDEVTGMKKKKKNYLIVELKVGLEEEKGICVKRSMQVCAYLKSAS